MGSLNKSCDCVHACLSMCVHAVCLIKIAVYRYILLSYFYFVIKSIENSCYNMNEAEYCLTDVKQWVTLYSAETKD